MNNSEEQLKRLRDPKWYLENLCKIKTKEVGLQPFILNNAQKDLFNTLRKHNRVIINKCRQIGFCLHPDTKIMTSNFQWIKLDDVKVGQEIVAVDEHVVGGKGSSRKMRKAIVENKWDVYEPAFKIIMSNGQELIATGKHKFLFQYRGAVHTEWRTVSSARVGDKIRNLVDPWNKIPNYEDGWFAGIIDGEGSLCKNSRTGAALTISQTEGHVWKKMVSYAQDNNLNFRIEVDRREPGVGSKLGSKEVNKLMIGQMGDIFKVFGICKPVRMAEKNWWEGKKMPGKGNSWHEIVSIQPLGEMRMIDLQTSEKTFIANGFVSHNSTAVTGYFYHKTITTPGTNTALIGYNSDLTAELLEKVKMFHKSTPAELRPTISYNSKYEISFPNIDSKILVLPSTDNVGRGYTLHNALLTELSAWEKAEEKMMTLEASVPINGQIVVESTPRGMGNLYHRMMMSENDYIKKEYGWWWHYSEEEIERIRKRMNNPQAFAQEYALEFLSSGRPVFDITAIRKQRKNVLNVGDIYADKTGRQHRVHEEDGLRIYKEPESDGMYIVGVDTSEGVEGGDYATAVFLNRKTGEEVAFYRGHISPDKFGEKLNKWGRRFNNALMVVEINNHGLTVVTILRQLIYPSLYFRPTQFEKMGTGWSDKIGWKTTKVTRPLLIDDLAQAIRDDILTIHSKEILDEMTVFVYDKNNNPNAPSGYHDDGIFGIGTAFQGFKVLWDKPLTQVDYNQHLPMSSSY